VRALELLRAGAPVGDAQRCWRDGGTETEEAVLYVGLTLPRATLAERLRARAVSMIACGLADEVRVLLARGYDPSLPAMQGIGYREFALVVRGALDETEALRRMQRDTVRYAKRQWTWFAREVGLQWLDVDLCGGADGVARLLVERVKRIMLRQKPETVAADLAAMRERLLGLNALVGESDHGVSKSLYGHDPDGIEFEVLDADPRRVKRVRIHRSKQAPGGPDEARPVRGAAAALPPSAITSMPAAEPATASTDPAKAARQP